MKIKKHFILALTCLMIVSVFSIGCTPAKRPLTDDPYNNSENNTMRAPNGNQELGQRDYNGNSVDRMYDNFNGMDNGINEYGVGDNNLNGMNGRKSIGMVGGQQAEDKIKSDVEQITGVQNAVVLINGNTAYVGIDAEGSISGNKMNDLKDQVIEKARRSNNDITRVYVSADMDVTDRLKGYGTEVREGKPIKGLIDEIEEMFRRPMPKS